MDSAFKSAPYAGCMTRQLQEAIDNGTGNPAMTAEIIRRGKVAAGDVSVMTDGERLRHARSLDAALQVRVAGEFTPEMLRLIRKLAGMHAEVRDGGNPADAEGQLAAQIERMIEGE